MPLLATKDDGGPAFPPQHQAPYAAGGFQQGMSLRDWLAGQAVGEMIAAERAQPSDESYSPERIAKWSYEIADAMLEARKK